MVRFLNVWLFSSAPPPWGPLPLSLPLSFPRRSRGPSLSKGPSFASVTCSLSPHSQLARFHLCNFLINFSYKKTCKSCFPLKPGKMNGTEWLAAQHQGAAGVCVRKADSPDWTGSQKPPQAPIAVTKPGCLGLSRTI